MNIENRGRPIAILIIKDANNSLGLVSPML